MLGKAPTAYGYYTPDKVNAMIQDSLDFIAHKMMKISNGWLTHLSYADITANSPYVDLPNGMAILNFVKIKPSDGSAVYTPLSFNENAFGASAVESVGSAVPYYRFSAGRLYLEPVPTVSVANGLMFDGVFYPSRLLQDGDEIDGDMNNMAFINYAKWRAASQLFSLTAGDAKLPPWQASEVEWKQSVMELISRRFREPTVIRSIDY